jgi:hypothetical protein
MTAEQQMFTQKFKPSLSKADKKRKIPIRHIEGRGAFIKKNGGRRGNVKPGTLKKHLDAWL